MPSSTIVGKSAVAIILSKLRTKVEIPYVLDVGPGLGTYRRMMAPLLPDARWYAVEIWAPYVKTFQLHDIYDAVYVADVNCFDFGILPLGGIAIIGDVLEHIPKDLAIAKISRMLKRMNYVILSVPIGDWPQDDVGGNPWEAHVHSWWLAELYDALGQSLAGVVTHRFNPRQAIASVVLGRTTKLRKLAAAGIEEADRVTSLHQELTYCGQEFTPDLNDENTLKEFYLLLARYAGVALSDRICIG